MLYFVTEAFITTQFGVTERKTRLAAASSLQQSLQFLAVPSIARIK